MTDILPAPIQADRDNLVATATRKQIATPADYQDAGELLRAIKTVRGRIADTFDAPIRAAHAAHKSMIQARDKHDEPLARCEIGLKSRMSGWKNEQDRIAREREAELQRAAQRAEEERRLREAGALAESGQEAAADALLDMPVVAPVVVVPTEAPKVPGVSSRKVWRWRLADITKVPREYLVVDAPKVNLVVRGLGDQARIPGIEVYPDDVMSARAF